ncbi:unnamed protein product [Agarophyton chilense]
MTSRPTFHIRSDDDEDDLVTEHSYGILTPNSNESKIFEREENNQESVRTMGADLEVMHRQSAEMNVASRAGEKVSSSKAKQGSEEKKRRGRGRTRRHFSRQKAHLSSSAFGVEEQSNDIVGTVKMQYRRSCTRPTSSKMSRITDGTMATRSLPAVERTASEPAVASTKGVHSVMQNSQSSLNRMRSFQRKAPHEMHREIVQRLRSSSECSTRVFGQLSFGVVRLMSEEDVLRNEDGAILSGGVNKERNMSKRGNVEEYYEKGSLRDLDRARSKQDGSYKKRPSA